MRSLRLRALLIFTLALPAQGELLDLGNVTRDTTSGLDALESSFATSLVPGDAATVPIRCPGHHRRGLR